MMGSPGDSPGLVGDSPTRIARSDIAKSRSAGSNGSLTFRPASRRTEQAGRLCYPEPIFKTRSRMRFKAFHFQSTQPVFLPRSFDLFPL